MKMNNSPLTPQQKELKKRLEEIRRKRNAETASPRPTADSPPKRNKGAQRTRPKERKQPQMEMPSPPSIQRERKVETPQPSIVEREIGAPRKKRRQTASTSPKRKKSPLIQQLTNRDSLANAMILNEVLSKPIALRKRNR